MIIEKAFTDTMRFAHIGSSVTDRLKKDVVEFFPANLPRLPAAHLFASGKVNDAARLFLMGRKTRSQFLGKPGGPDFDSVKPSSSKHSFAVARSDFPDMESRKTLPLKNHNLPTVLCKGQRG